MSLFLLRNVALDLIRLFLKSTIKAISSRFTSGFHGSNLKLPSRYTQRSLLLLAPDHVFCDINVWDDDPAILPGPLSLMTRTDVNQFLPRAGQYIGGCVSDWKPGAHTCSLPPWSPHRSPRVINTWQLSIRFQNLDTCHHWLRWVVQNSQD